MDMNKEKKREKVLQEVKTNVKKDPDVGVHGVYLGTRTQTSVELMCVWWGIKIIVILVVIGNLF